MKSSLVTLLCLTTTLSVIGAAAVSTTKAPLSPRTSYALRMLFSQACEKLLVKPTPSVAEVSREKARDARDLLIRTLLDIPLAKMKALPHAQEEKDDAKEPVLSINYPLLQEMANGPECEDILMRIATDIEYGFAYSLEYFFFPHSLTIVPYRECLNALGETEATIIALWKHGRSFYKQKDEIGKHLEELRFSLTQGRECSPQEQMSLQLHYEKAFSDYTDLHHAWLKNATPLMELYKALYDRASVTSKAQAKSPEELNKYLQH